MAFPYRILFIIFLVCSVLILIDSNRFADPDLFCHLYSGKEIFEKAKVHKTDTHSFSVYGDPWIDYEWMARVIYFILFKYIGSTGLVFFRLFISLLIFLLIYKNSEHLSGSFSFSIFSVILGAAASYRYFLFRPQLFTFLFLVLLIFILYRYQSDASRREIILFPALFLIWSNLHAGFPMGLLFFGLFIFSLIIGKSLNGRCGFFGYPIPIKTISFLLFIFLISLLVTLLNPYGINLWKGIFKTVFGTFTPELSEWKPVTEFPFFRLFWFYLFLFFYAISFIISKRKRVFDLFLLLVLGYLSMTKVRFIPITSIIMTPSLSLYLKEAADRVIGKGKKIPVLLYSRQALSFYLLLSVICIPMFTMMLQGKIHLNTFIYKTDFYQPVAPVKLIKGNDFQGNVMNEYDWGGYIHWELPNSRIFVDGRSDTVYPHEIIRKWASFVNGEEGWRRFLEESEADAILIRSSHLVNDQLKELNDWQLIYFDNIASLYINIESPRNAKFLKKWIGNSLLIEKTSFSDHIL